jgi:hypothetical protein
MEQQALVRGWPGDICSSDAQATPQTMGGSAGSPEDLDYPWEDFLRSPHFVRHLMLNSRLVG